MASAGTARRHVPLLVVGLWLMVMMLSACGSAPTASRGLIPNSSFEDVRDGRPVGWVVRNPGQRGCPTLIVENGHRGGRSVGFRGLCFDGRGSPAASWSLDKPISVEPSKAYLLGVWANIAGGSCSCRVFLLAVSPDGSFGPFPAGGSKGDLVLPATDGTWQYTETIIPKNDPALRTGLVQFRLFYQGSGNTTALWDDLQLVVMQ
jgi:hypothetical protein